jgi:hypothetical protein
MFAEYGGASAGKLVMLKFSGLSGPYLFSFFFLFLFLHLLSIYLVSKA